MREVVLGLYNESLYIVAWDYNTKFINYWEEIVVIFLSFFKLCNYDNLINLSN